MGRCSAWLTCAGLTALLVLSLLLTPRADAQAAHLPLGHGGEQSTAAGHTHHSATGERSHEHHHTMLHTAGALAQPSQPDPFTGAVTFTSVPPGVVAEPAPPAAWVRDTGQPPQALLQVWRN